MLHSKLQERNLNTGRALEFQCDKGYSLVGDPLVVCMGGNTWRSAFPTCQCEKLIRMNEFITTCHCVLYCLSVFILCLTFWFLYNMSM